MRGVTIPRYLRAWILVIVAAFSFTSAAAIRVGRVDSAVVGTGSIVAFLIPPLVALVAGVVAGWLLDRLVGLAARTIGRLRRRAPDAGEPVAPPQRNAREGLVLALLGLAGTWAAFKWLALPLTPASVPIIGNGAARYLLPITIVCLAEVALAAWMLGAGDSVRRRIVRVLVRLGWIGLGLLMLLGPNIFRADPLEWASRLGSSRVSVAWLESATAVVTGLWPIGQVLLAGVLVRVLFDLVGDVRRLPGPRR
jgi:hypothetical protein